MGDLDHIRCNGGSCRCDWRAGLLFVEPYCRYVHTARRRVDGSVKEPPSSVAKRLDDAAAYADTRGGGIGHGI